MTMTSHTKHNWQHCSLFKRLLAILYDVILLAALIFCAFVPIAFIPQDWIAKWVFILFKQLYLVAICFAYFALNWKYYQQTPGMRIWKIMLISQANDTDNTNLSFRQVSIRFFTAIISAFALGLGFVVSLLRKDKQCWHDRMSSTAIVELK